jgi:hypothetical protein
MHSIFKQSVNINFTDCFFYSKNFDLISSQSYPYICPLIQTFNGTFKKDKPPGTNR